MTVNDWTNLKAEILLEAPRFIAEQLELIEDMSDELRWAMYGEAGEYN